MRNSRKSSANCTLFAVVIVLTTSWLLSGVAVAQGTQGQNAVFSSSGTCSQCAGSSAFIDASTFVRGLAQPYSDTTQDAPPVAVSRVGGCELSPGMFIGHNEIVAGPPLRCL